MGSNEEIIQLLQKTQTIFKQTQRDKEEKYLNDIIQLQDKIKDLENVVCKMGRSTETLRLLTSEHKAFKDNLLRELARQKDKNFKSYALRTYQVYKETILAYLNTIDKMIDERACHEEELRITKKDVKNKQEKLKMEKQEIMIQKSEYISPGDNSDAKREKQKKKENCSKTFQKLKMVVLVINPRQLFAKESEFAFEAKGPDIRLSNDTKPLHEVDQDAEQCLENKTKRVHKENLRATLSEFLVNHICRKEDSSPSSTNELEKESRENTCDNAKSEFQTKFIELEKVLTQQTKDFDDVKLELSNRTAKFETYFEKLENSISVLEHGNWLAPKVDDSKAEKDHFLKEINHLRTQL
ncbi:hypothetical protein Tco_0265489 [Tanacetum coccineum]